MRGLLLTCTLLLASPALAGDTTPLGGDDIRVVATSPVYTGPTVVPGDFSLSKLTDGVNWSSWASPLRGGVWLRYQFAGTRYVSKVQIIPGCAGSGRTFNDLARPRELVLESNGRTVTLQVDDRRAEQVLDVVPALPAQQLTVRVAEVYRGRRQAVCFTELHFHELTALGTLSPETRVRLEEHAVTLAGEDAAAAIAALTEIGPAAVPRLTMALSDAGDPGLQKNVLAALREIGAPSAAPALLRFWATGPEGATRALAIEALARTGHDSVVDIVVAALADRDLEVADRAAAAIEPFGVTVLPGLERLLESEHPDVVARALGALQHVPDARVVALAARFFRAERSKLRAAAALAVGATGVEAAVPVLRRLALDRHPAVRNAVATALGRIPSPEADLILARLLRDRDPFVGSRALEVLAQSSTGVRHLATYLTEEYAPLGNAAVEFLATTRSAAAMQVVLDALRRGEARFRRALREAVVSYGPAGIEALAQAALEDEALRFDAETVLSAHPLVAVRIIDEVVSRNPSTAPIFLLRALGKGRGAGSLQVLDKVWASGTPSLRVVIVKAWAYYPPAAVRDRVLAAVRGSDPTLRAEAARAGATAGVMELAPLLTEALTSGDIPAAVAIEGLGKLADPSGEPYMVANFKYARMGVRLATLHACKRLETPACLTILYGATNDNDDAIRIEALKLLASR